MKRASLLAAPLLLIGVMAACGSTDDGGTEAVAGGAGSSAGKGGGEGKGGSNGSQRGGASSEGGEGGSAEGGSTAQAGQGGSTESAAGAAGTDGEGDAGGSPLVCDPPGEPAPDPGSGVCPDFTPCGGDLTGLWNISETCSDPPLQSYSILCGGGTDTTELFGTADFQANGDYVTQGGIHQQGQISQACLDAWDRSCGENPFEDCTVSAGGGCDCDHTSDLGEPSTGRTWSASGNVLQTFRGCEVLTSYYCVEGDTLSLRGLDDGQQYVLIMTR